MAIRTLARRHRVRAGQRESGAAVVEGCIQPGSSVVALIASLREIGSDVIRIRRSLKISQVTAYARG